MTMKIYMASKAKHRVRWRAMRDGGLNIVARWIDTNDDYIGTSVGENDIDYETLWKECLEDIWAADVLCLYVAEGEILKGALVELGAATALGKPVFVCGSRHGMTSNGTWYHLPNITIIEEEPESFFPYPSND